MEPLIVEACYGGKKMRNKILFLLGLFLFSLIVYTQQSEAVSLTRYFFYENFTGIDNNAISIPDRALTNWATLFGSVTNCTYSGERGVCSAEATPEPTNGAQLYPTGTANVTCKYDFSITLNNSLSDTVASSNMYNAVIGSEFTRVLVNQSGHLNAFNGSENLLLLPIANNTNYTVYHTYGFANSCSYYAQETDDISVNAGINDTGCSSTATGAVGAVVITSRASNSNVTYDNYYCWAGMKEDDPEESTVFIDAPFEQAYYMESELLNLSIEHTLVGNVNTTFYVGENTTEIVACDACSNIIEFDLAPYIGFGKLNITVNVKDASETAQLNTTIQFFRGAVLETDGSLLSTNNRTLNFTVFDQLTNGFLENISYSAQFVAWQNSIENNVTVNRTFSTDGTTDHSFTIYTINNQSISMNSNYFVDYSASGYPQRRYLQNGATLTTTQQDISLYLLASGNTTEITFTLVDNRQQPVEGLTLEAYLFAVGDIYTLIDSGISDISGQVQFNLQEDQEYKYLIKRGTTLLKTIAKFRPIQTSYTFQIDLDPDTILRNLRSFENLFYNLTYNNDSSVVTLQWSSTGNIITLSCLQLVNQSVAGNVMTVNTTCDSSNGGTITMNAIELGINNSYGIANYYVTSYIDSNNYTLASLSIDLRLTWQQFGIVGLFALLITVLTMVMAFADVPVLFVIGIMLSAYLWWFTGISGMTWMTMLSIISVGGVLVFFMRNR